MTPVDQAQWVEVPAEFEIELDRPVCSLGGENAEVLQPGVYPVSAIRHWAVRFGDGPFRGGDTWFRIALDGRPLWVRATACAPYASETWD